MGERKRVIALGFFDGIHIGHAALLERTVQRAREIGAMPSVLSFDIHPDTLVFGKEVPLINSAAGRADLIRRLFGIENVIFINCDTRDEYDEDHDHGDDSLHHGLPATRTALRSQRRSEHITSLLCETDQLSGEYRPQRRI